MRGPKGCPPTAALAHRDAAHRLDAGGDHDVVGSRHHALGREVERLLARAALAVDAGAADALGKPCSERRVATDVHPLLADLRDAPHDDVLDLGRIDARPLDERRQRAGREVHGVHGEEPAGLLAAPERGADGVHDHGFSHRRLLSPRSGACSSPARPARS